MKLAGKLLLVICARCACACAYTADHGEGRLRSAGVAAHGGAGHAHALLWTQQAGEAPRGRAEDLEALQWATAGWPIPGLIYHASQPNMAPMWLFVARQLTTARSRRTRSVVHDSARCVAAPFFN